MFFTDRIDLSKPKSLEEIAKSGASKVTSLDELLAGIDAKNKGVVKTAAAEATVKTASTEAPVVEAPKAEVKAEAAAPVQEKVAEHKVLLPKGVAEKDFEEDEEGKGGEGDPENEEDLSFKGKGGKGAPWMKNKKASKVSLKIAKSLDFTSWKAEEVVKAWAQHGTFEKCCANVAGKTTDAKAYCGLLSVASQESDKVIKTAAFKAKQASEVKTEEAPSGTFKKIAKLSEKERGWLGKYWTTVYGPEYAKAMLEDN